MDQEKVIILFFQVALIAFILITLFIILIIIIRNRRNADINKTRLLKMEYEDHLKQTRIEVQENTFTFIAKELHDNVGQLLSSSRMLLGVMERSMEQAPETLLTANATLGEAINELRTLSKALNRDWLERFNLFENLEKEIVRLNKNSETKVSLTIDGDVALDSPMELILFRVIQESVQNSLKHSKASAIEIAFARNASGHCVLISDDGCGFDPLQTPAGMGLGNMKERIAILKGEIRWQASASNGTKVIIQLPH